MKAMFPLSTRLSQLLDESLRGEFVDGESGYCTPAANVVELEDGFEIELDLPGVSPPDLNVEFKEGQLRVEGSRKAMEQKEGAKIHRQERRFGRFLRAFALPRDVDADNISADYADGVLTLQVPRKAEARVKKIEIRG